jgi:amino acid adenylation domain-containing protein
MDELARLGVELRVEDGRLRFRAPEGVMTAELKARIAADKEALVARLSGHLEADPEIITRPASETQKRLWFVNEMQGPNVTYNIPMCLRLKGKLDVEALHGSVEALVKRHQCLHCRFIHDGDELRLEMLRDLPAPWATEDLSELPVEKRDSRRREIAGEIAGHCFDLSKAPLLIVKLVKLSAESHDLFLNVHHIAADGWSCAIITKEIAAGYEALTGRGQAVPEPLWKFTDYLDWQEYLQKSGATNADLDFWRGKLKNMPPSTTLPTDRPRPEVQEFTGGTVPLAFDAETTSRLRSRAREWGTSLNHVLLAATAALISARCGRDDVILGMPLANRTRREIEGVVGMMVNTIPLRLKVPPDTKPDSLAHSVRDCCNEAFAHCNLPFERLVGEVETGRNLSLSPIFQIAYNFLPPMESRPSFGGLEVETDEFQGEGKISKYDATFYYEEKGDGIRGSIEYSDRLYNLTTVEGWARDLTSAVTAMLDKPGEPLRQSAGFGARIWQPQCVGSDVSLPDISPWECFAQAANSPDTPALIEGESTLSHEELKHRAEWFSSVLATHGVAKGNRVGIKLPRGIDYAAAMLGVVRLGAIFVPFDTALPHERLLRMAKLAGLSAIVCLENDDVDGLAPATVRIGPSTWRHDAPLALPVAPAVAHDDPLYMIFTSGSTGEPKGVLIPWRGLNNVIAWATTAFELGPGVRASQIASNSFDASLLEMWPTLCSGGTLIFIPDLLRLDPVGLRDWILREKIDCHFSPTPLAESLLDLDWPNDTSLRVLYTGGQMLHRRPKRGAPFRFLNCYGPTEVSILVTSTEVSPEGDGLPDIGGAIPNTRLAVLDDAGNAVEPGMSGELVASGTGVALGYFGNEEATTKTFVRLEKDPANALWYRTGDMVRLRGDGRLDYIGRRDGQVKLRGYRIETGDVEHALMSVPNVRQAVVRAEGDVLAAYVETGDSRMTADEIRASVAKTLPSYMVPSRISVMERLPRQTSGKIDLKALKPAAEPIRSSAEKLNEAQASVARAWSEILNLSSPGLDDNFFDVGGHSLLLVKLKDRITALTTCEIGILDLFRNPTIRRQAALIGGKTIAEKREPAPKRARIASDAPIAVIGMAGRFPQAENIAEFWRNLCAGRESISFFSRDELLKAGVPAELADNPNYVPANGVLKNIERFDAGFFGVPAREAEIMDPQQRLLLEEAWHCFEDAGVVPSSLKSRVGVYVGSSMNGYVINNVLPRREIMEGIGGWAVMVANDKDFSATRISYKLDLRGPSVSVNTACSTSLVAVHQAVTALRDGQCEMALAGGACVRSNQIDGYLYEDGGVLSRDGHCRAFDADASGMVGGNAVALVLLKPLEAALADGDPIRAVIRGIAADNDGSDKIGFTAPGIAGQTAVIRDALDRAGVAPDSVGYVETHGTGTKLGDSIEVAALAANYAPEGKRPAPLVIGSVKTNVGHLDSAAGVTGLIKAALCLENKTLVPSLHFKTPNPEIQWPANAFRVSTATAPFDGPAPRRAAVSSLGIGGTNVHAILEEAPETAYVDPPDDANPKLLLLSGKGEISLAANAKALGKWLDEHSEVHVGNVAHTLAFGRRHWETRTAFAASTVSEAVQRLSEPLPPFANAARVAFLFTGMGTHKPGMGLAPYEHSTVVRNAIDECADLLKPVLDLDIRKLLLANPADANADAILNEHRYGQPTVFALEYALARFWMDLGIRPSYVAGHSLGEWVGATLASVFDLPDALKLVSLRGRLMDEREKGAMLAINLTEGEVAARLPQGLDIATVNAPDQIVVAGPADKVEAFAQAIEREEIRCKRLAVTLAAHSSLMEPLLPELREAVAAVKRHAPAADIALVSDTTGTIAAPERLQEPDYWTEHLRRCVRFADCLGTFFREPDTLLLECGPSHTLCNIALRDVRRPAGQTALASLDGGETSTADEWKRMLETAGALWACGLPVDLDKLYALQGEGRRISMPGYVFQGKRHWLEPVAITTSVTTRRDEPDGADEAAEIASADTATPEERLVIGLMRELLGYVRLNPSSDFFLSGGDSLLAVRLATRIAVTANVSLTRAQVMKARTVANLARLITEQNTGNASGETHPAIDKSGADCLMRLWKGDERQSPIVLLHAVGGGIFIYRDFIRALRSNHPVWGLQSSGLWDDMEPPESLRTQAELYYDCLKKAGVSRPVMIGGSSYGGIVAYELEQIFRERGEEGATIVMFDSPGPGHMPQKLDGAGNICAFLLNEGGEEAHFRAILHSIQSLDEAGREKLLLEKMREKLMPSATETDLRRQMRVFSRNLDNMIGWTAKPTQSRILFFKATQNNNPLLAKTPEQAWVPLADGGIEIIPAPGNHSSMLDDPNAAFLANEINRVLSSHASRP